MLAPQGWQINPDWPSDTTGIVEYLQDDRFAGRSKTFFVVDEWQFFLGGEGDVQTFPFRRGGVLVILGGQSYLVDPASRQVRSPRFTSRDLRGATYSEKFDVVVAEVDWGCGLVAFGPEGLAWYCPIQLSEIESFTVECDVVRVEVTRVPDKSRCALTLDLATGEEIAG
jgi:hypothetical protein